MAKNLKIATVACAGVVASGLAMAGYIAADPHSDGNVTSVALAVAPPQPMLGADPAADLAPSLPQTPPLPQRAPNIPSIDMASAAQAVAKPTGLGDAASIAVASRPMSVRAGPSEMAAMLYGFPAGRKVRVIGTEAGFAQIKDVESGAQGWVEKTALASGMLTASIEPRPARVRQAKAEIDTPKPVTGIPAKTNYRPMMLGGGESDSSAPRGPKTNFAGFLHKAFGRN